MVAHVSRGSFIKGCWLVVLALISSFGLTATASVIPTQGNWSSPIEVLDEEPDFFTVEIPIPLGATRVELSVNGEDYGWPAIDNISDVAKFFVDGHYQVEISCAPAKGNATISNLAGGGTLQAKFFACSTSINYEDHDSTIKWMFDFRDSYNNPVEDEPGNCEPHCDTFCGGRTALECGIDFISDAAEEVARVTEEVWGILKGVYGDDINPDSQFVDIWSAPGTKPIMYRPFWGRALGPHWIEAPTFPEVESDTVDFMAGCTASHGCDDYRWFLERLDPDVGFVPVQTFPPSEDDPRFENGEYMTKNAFTRMPGFNWDGTLYRSKVYQSVQDRHEWTLEHDDWKYFFNGIPDTPPVPPALISPRNGEVAGGNSVVFVLQNRGTEMMHPAFKYRVEVYKANPDGTIPEGTQLNENVNWWILGPDQIKVRSRGNVPPMGFNIEPFELQNDTALYYWRALATFAPDFSNPNKVTSSKITGFNTTKLNQSGTRFSAYGQNVDMYNTTSVVGAPYTAIGFQEQIGEVTVFEKVNDTWEDVASLLPDTPEEYDQFGYDVALGDRRLVVGSPGRGDFGRALVYTRSATGWNLSQTFGPGLTETTNPLFGRSVEIDGLTVLVGAPNGFNGKGIVYSFEIGSVGVDRTIIARDSSGNPEGQINGEFGASLAISGGDLFVGAPRANNQDGLVYVYHRQGSNWVQDSKISPPISGLAEHFGYALSIEGGTLMVGAPGEDVYHLAMNPDTGGFFKSAQNSSVYV